MSIPKVDAALFLPRLEKLYTSWESEGESLWAEADALAVAVGKDEVTYSKSSSLQIWLFGYELADTLFVFCANHIYVMAGKKKLQFLQPLAAELEKRDDLPNFVMTPKLKNESDDESLKTIADSMKKSKSAIGKLCAHSLPNRSELRVMSPNGEIDLSVFLCKGKKVGVFRKDVGEFTGSFVESWREAVRSTKMTEVDVSAAFAYTSAPKDPSEVSLLKGACQHTCKIFNTFVKPKILNIVDKEERVKHSKVAEDVESAMLEGKYLPKGLDMDNESVDICYSPIIQSGGKYQLKFSTVSNEDRLHFGTIVISLGVRYKSYCANIARTMFVEPSQEKQENYQFLVSVYERVLEQVREGVRMCDVYNTALDIIEKEKPHLKEHFTRSIGFASGIEFREGSLTLSPKCILTIRKGMSLNINMGFANLSDPEGKHSADRTYAMFIGDTVLAGDENSPAEELTSSSVKKIKKIAIFMGPEEEDGDNNGAIPELDEVLRSRDRGARVTDQSAGRRKEHQSELTKKMNQEARKRLLDNNDDAMAKRPKLSTNVAYKHSSVVPRDADVQNHRIFVDRKYEAVVLPIFGIATPFHVSMIKNTSKSEEGEYVYLRVNFFHPGSSMGRVDGVLFPNPEATFIKELSFRASVRGGAGSNLAHVFTLIKDLQKRFKTREMEKKELEGYVEQAALILSTGRGNPRLKDLYMRPIISGSRRIQGTLEAHTNGLRYTTIKGDKVDILYSNIKHAFFQPSKKQMIVLLHFHLKHPLLIGKKKHKDIQFYTEVGEIMTDLGRAQHMHDRDDLMAEQAERELRAKLDNAFDSFAKKVEGLPQCRIHFEKPFRELGFDGVPTRSTVFLQPTTNCLVNLSDQPAFIITLDEVELVHFERVQFHMKNFDMVFIFKDYKRKATMITAIPMTQLDSIKDWLNQCNIKFTEGVQSLNWTKIMKTINDDPEGFFDNGGWSFLDPESDSGSDEDESEESDAYQPSDSDEGSAGSEEDSDEDYSDVSEGGSESEYEGSEEEESGMDWDELEAEAKKADKERDINHREEEEDTRRRVHSKKPTKLTKRRK